MSRRDLTAAGILDPELRASYERCRELNARHGKTYYLATLLLPPAKRPYVHALYGFARYADEIVDDLASTLTDQEKSAWLNAWGQAFLSDVRRGRSDDPIGKAVVDTVLRWEIPLEHFEAFLASMTMDLTVTEYPTYDDLFTYVYGSAAGDRSADGADPRAASTTGPTPPPRTSGSPSSWPTSPATWARTSSAAGSTSPSRTSSASDSAAPTSNAASWMTGSSRLLAFQIARVRRLEAASRPGIAFLHPTSRPCIEAARVLYCGIVDEVEAIDYQVFDQRATVPLRRRLRVAGGAWTQAVRARRATA